MYERCKKWFKTEDSTAYLYSHTGLGSAQLQLRAITNDTVGSSNDEGAPSLFRRPFVRPRDTIFSR